MAEKCENGDEPTIVDFDPEIWSTKTDSSESPDWTKLTNPSDKLGFTEPEFMITIMPATMETGTTFDVLHLSIDVENVDKVTFIFETLNETIPKVVRNITNLKLFINVQIVHCYALLFIVRPCK